MAGINKVAHGDDEVYEAVTAVIQGGQLVVPSTTATTNPNIQGVVVAGDAALNVIGVAAREALPVSAQTTSGGTDGDGYPITAPFQVSELTTVYSHAVVPVTYTAAVCAFGAAVCAAATGKVRAWVSGTDSPAAIVGYCRVVGGMSSAGGVGLIKIER